MSALPKLAPRDEPTRPTLTLIQGAPDIMQRLEALRRQAAINRATVGTPDMSDVTEGDTAIRCPECESSLCFPKRDEVMPQTMYSPAQYEHYLECESCGHTFDEEGEL